jgi:hypothetical protein
MDFEDTFLNLPTGSRRYGRLAACGTTFRFMGSVHGFSSVHDALEPAGTFNVQRSTFNVQRETINHQPPNHQLVHGKHLDRPAAGVCGE